MTGSATFSGTNYQAGVIANIYVHILRQAPLGWFEEQFIDAPVAVSGETEGPGDDAAIEYGEHHRPVEVQAKHGLTAGTKLSEAVASIANRSRSEEEEVVLVVDRSTSRTVHRDFAADLERYRTGRRDRLRAEITRIITELGEGSPVLQRLRVVVGDFDRASDPERRLAIDKLERSLVDASQAEAAWAVLMQDAANICAKRLRRTRGNLIELLAAKGIALRPSEADETAMQQLDISKRLIAEGRGGAVLSYIALIESDLKGKKVSPKVWHRLHQHRAAAFLMLHRFSEALASAREALSIDPTGIPALLTAGHAAVETGDTASAREYFTRALKIEPGNADVWAARVQIDSMEGATPAEPPPEVRDSPPYQFALAQIAMNSGDLSDVITIGNRLVAQGKRDPQLLLILITALTATTLRDGDASLGDAERLAEEAIDELGDEHPLAARFLAQRAELRHLRGDEAGCEADLERARRLRDDEPNALAQLALSQLHAGHADQVIVTLSSKQVDEHPMLLLIRARAKLTQKDPNGAKQDFHRATALAADAPDPNAFRLHAAEIALDLKDLGAAERLLEAAADTSMPHMLHVLRGRIAFERRDAEGMERAFRGAVESVPTIKSRLFPELAQRLVRLGKYSEAVAVFEEVDWEDLPTELHGDYAGALVASNDLAKASKLVTDATDDESTPDWKLHIGSEIAARRGDIAGAVSFLRRIAARHPDNMQLAYEVARRLLLMRQPSAAAAFLDVLLRNAPQLDPQQKMAVAYLLKDAGREDDAVRLAFRAYRAAPHDPAMHRGFGGLLVHNAKPVTHPGFVTGDTYVKLVAETGETVEYLILSQPPIDPLRHEMLVETAERAGLIGKYVDEIIVTDESTWQEKRWNVAEILPAVVYVWRDVMEHYKTRFPAEPFFVQMFKMSDEPSVRDFAPLVSSLQARRTQAEDVFKLYRENILPLGFVAGILGVSIAEVMAGAMTAELGPLPTEWFDAEGQENSRAVARSATEVVMTRSALETLADNKLLDVIQPLYTWVAPQSLLETLEGELLEAEDRNNNGQRTLKGGATGLQADELPANHPVLVGRVDRLKNQIGWVRDNARPEFRPLETIRSPESAEENIRAKVGADSIDAVNLADHLGIPMFADDLGLRKFEPRGTRVSSFCTLSLVPILAERGAITANERDRLLLDLIKRRYIMPSPSKSLLLASVAPEQESPSLARNAYSLLGSPSMELDAAASIVVEVLRDVALAPLQTTSIARIVVLALDGMGLRWPPKLSAYALVKAAEVQLALLPTQLTAILDTVLEYLKRKTSPS